MAINYTKLYKSILITCGIWLGVIVLFVGLIGLMLALQYYPLLTVTILITIGCIVTAYTVYKI